MRTKPITVADISARHPKGLIFDTDKEYASVGQKVYRILKDKIIDMPDVTVRNMAVNCALYLEDIASNLGVWESFVTLHRDLYGKDLPFFETGDDYCLGDPNIQDIKLILWLSTVQTREESIINPETPHLNKVSKLVFECIDDAFDEVHVNEQYYGFLYSAELYENFLVQRDILKWLYLDCYLTRALDRKEMLKEKQDRSDIFLPGIDAEKRYYAAECDVCFSCKCGPLALYPKDYLARMLELAGMKTQACFVSMETFRQISINKVLKWGEKSVEYADANGQTFEVQLKSYDDNVTGILGKYTFNIGSFVNYKGEWMSNGISSWGEMGLAYNAIAAEYAEQRKEAEIVRNYIGANPSKRLVYARNCDELKEKYEETGLKFSSDLDKKFRGAKDFVIFISEIEGICVIGEVASLIAAPDNPLYNSSAATAKASFRLIFNTSAVPGEFVRYLVREHLLPDAALNSIYSPQRGKELFQENIDFFARLFRQNEY